MIALKCRRVSPAAARARPRGSVGIEAGSLTGRPVRTAIVSATCRTMVRQSSPYASASQSCCGSAGAAGSRKFVGKRLTAT